MNYRYSIRKGSPAGLLFLYMHCTVFLIKTALLQNKMKGAVASTKK